MVRLQIKGQAVGFLMLAAVLVGFAFGVSAAVARPKTRPQVTLYRPLPDVDRDNGVVLSWDATPDNNKVKIVEVTLAWAEKPEGPWHDIAGPSLPESGQYSWQVPKTVPASVYLRITVSDSGCGVTVAAAQEPYPLPLRSRKTR
jgi:hypothetical protein